MDLHCRPFGLIEAVSNPVDVACALLLTQLPTNTHALQACQLHASHREHDPCKLPSLTASSSSSCTAGP